jgi:hypothetical protein
MELYVKFLPSVIKVCLPMSLGQNRIIHLVPAKCDEITCTSMSAYEQNESIHYVPANWNRITSTRILCLRAQVRMEGYIKFLP